MGVSKLVDLLHDEREVIRNDVNETIAFASANDRISLQALLLLQILTESNANIQKIVAFENGFERLFEILTSEGGCQGSAWPNDDEFLL